LHAGELFCTVLILIDPAPPQLSFARVAPGKAFHAAVIAQRGHEEKLSHTHDFWEMMYVLAGEGAHWLGGRSLPLQAGQLLLIRPHDHHVVRVESNETLHFFNLAFPEEPWRGFCAVARLEEALEAWENVLLPPHRVVSPPRREECIEAFRRALEAFVEGPTLLELCRFWSAVLPLLLPAGKREAPAKTVPPWLRRARQAMQDEDNLRLGVPRLVALSGVSPAHLARTFRACYGQTPTEFVNELRLRRSAMLLRTTSWEIIHVAYDCGFHNLSYFYRLFTSRYGQTPRAFRGCVEKPLGEMV
jgi:AraC-like DNA-binding protein/mannose-6-phosphate isomerase-like protein (cupin superfamily)